MNKRTYVGLDVHARSVKGCAIDHETGEILRQSLAANDAGIAEWVSGLPGPVLVVYEAGPTGFGLARLLAGAGIECVVAAPSELQWPSGDRVKTDARDAEHLARLALLGQIVPVRVPSPTDEAARDLVRAREDVRADLMRARHRVIANVAVARDWPAGAGPSPPRSNRSSHGRMNRRVPFPAHPGWLGSVEETRDTAMDNRQLAGDARHC
jgi:hypothetical protein